jgi:hypothetical protein
MTKAAYLACNQKRRFVLDVVTCNPILDLVTMSLKLLDLLLEVHLILLLLVLPLGVVHLRMCA